MLKTELMELERLKFEHKLAELDVAELELREIVPKLELLKLELLKMRPREQEEFDSSELWEPDPNEDGMPESIETKLESTNELEIFDLGTLNPDTELNELAHTEQNVGGVDDELELSELELVKLLRELELEKLRL